ncbi:arabinose ABC transporter permease [Aphanothece hegewaldii CCALA 016]|uniref:Arabinose ABC transporter permease n=1 Tax=Aphanothece hegewaldii CCALA 016 TaxID=2107694 RepID=A0A2T1M2K8_9CHRO|nr:MFS transporter [Aphanothece hegewaldii]PSF38981.1 arabinose ABC transporter permease [Aphanothece hegewaldii CCALA 016]
MSKVTAKSSTWLPLRHSLFRDRLIALIISSVGTWMQDTAGTWLMTSLTTSPLLIALMQTAATLPILLLGLPAGATADIFDRRKLLIFWQSWMLVTALILSVLTFMGWMNPWLLLTLTFCLSLGAAMNNPAWQAIVPELVPRSELPAAIALNSVGFNLARALGPALGGLVVAGFSQANQGAGFVFALNSLSFIAVIFVLYQWHRQPILRSALPTERLFSSIRAGLRYVNHTPAIKAIFIRSFAQMSCLSAMWALLAVVAQQYLKQGAMGYGVLNGCIGLGAIIGAVFLPKIRQRLSADGLLMVSALFCSTTLLIMAYVHYLPIVMAFLFVAGIAWISTTSTLNIAIQLSVAPWVQARTLGVYQMVFQGGLAVGSIVWGIVAEQFGTTTALVCAAVGLIGSLPLAWRYRLMTEIKSDLTPSLHWTEPQVVIELNPSEGPVLVTIEYRINPADEKAFIKAIHKLRLIRLRDGAIRWGIFHDITDASRFVETFVVESWLEHLRQHERFTKSDRLIQQQVRSFHQGEKPPLTSHMIYAHLPN